MSNLHGCSVDQCFPARTCKAGRSMTPSHSSNVSSASTTQGKPVIGVLLVHGLNGDQGDFKELETILRVRGMVVVNMLLPGHGLKIRDMMTTGWDDWAKSVYEELRALKQRCDVVFLVGHSLGGA